jgi:lipid-A-disaccharide synthase
VAKPVRIFLSAGEASGDRYGALLIEALRGRLGAVECFGCGGERMRAAGLDAIVDAHSISMVGIVEVLPGLARAWRALQTLTANLQTRRPDLAILIDFPDFNLRLARRLKKMGLPVLYFVAPQVWAWRPWRLGTIRRTVDRLTCIFPFEEAFFRKARMEAQFVGHPLVGRVAPQLTAEAFHAQLKVPSGVPLIALLPGSRPKEIQLNLPPMLEAARQLASQTPCAFVLPAASAALGEWLRRRVALDGLPVQVVDNCTYDAVAHSDAAIVASGTAAVETALLGTPMVIVYRVSRATWLLGRWLVHTPFLSMVNLVSGHEVVPELIQGRFRPEAVVRAVRTLLDYPAVRARMREQLQEFADRLQVRRKKSLTATAPEPDLEDPIQRVAALAQSMLYGRRN